MQQKIKQLNQKIDLFLKSSLKINNPKLRLAIIWSLYVALFVFAFGLIPFILGFYFILVLNEKVTSNKLKYSLSVAVVLVTFIIGIPWARANYDEDYKAELEQQRIERELQREQEKADDEAKKAEEQRQLEQKQADDEAKKATEEAAKPKIEEKEENGYDDIPFEIKNENDSTLEKGKSVIKQEGINGRKQIRYRVTYTDGKETAREKISESVITQPTSKIVLIGTKVITQTQAPAASTTPATTVEPAPTTTTETSGCDPNYSGACVPIASDVDCAGGSGNGPAYVQGPVYIIGTDIYGLDRDKNGVACEN